MKKEDTVIQLHKPGINELLFFFLAGAIMSVPWTFGVNLFADQLLTGLSAFSALFVSVVVFAPFVEEFSKVFPLFYRHGETQRSIFNLALSVGFGFGIIEFLIYVFALGASPFGRLPGLLFHPASASITAYGIATKRPLQFYLVAVGLHFSNNFLAIFTPGDFPSSIIIVATAVFISSWLYGKTKEEFIDQYPIAQCPATI